jgi:hypothetical protein
LKNTLADAGLGDIRAGVGARKAGDPFTVLIASGTRRPSRARSEDTHRPRRSRARTAG